MSHQRAEALADHVTDLRRALNAEREGRLRAELEVERLREALCDVQPFRTESDGHCRHCDARIHQESHLPRCPFAALSAPPPALEELRELVRAAEDAALVPITVPSRLERALGNVRRTYSFLGEATP